MDLKKIERFIDKQKVCIICSIDNQEYPNVKAMLKPRKRNGLKEFYFSTNTSSKKPQKLYDFDSILKIVVGIQTKNVISKINLKKQIYLQAYQKIS